MTEKKRETAVARLAVLQKSPDLAGNLKEPFARCLDRKDRGSDGFRTRRADRGKGGAHLRSALVQYLLLRANDRIDQLMPHPADQGHHAVDIGIATRIRQAVAVGHHRRLGHCP